MGTLSLPGVGPLLRLLTTNDNIERHGRGNSDRAVVI